MAKKSRIRIFGKGLLLSVHLMLVLLLLYPQFFMPLGWIWVNGFLSLIAPYVVVLHLLFLFIWLIAKPILSLISVTTLAIAYPTILVLFAWHYFEWLLLELHHWLLYISICWLCEFFLYFCTLTFCSIVMKGCLPHFILEIMKLSHKEDMI